MSESEVTKEPIEVSELTVPAAAADFMVIAQRPDEMRAAQEKTIVWVKKHVQAAQQEVLEATSTLEAAVRNKWRKAGFQRNVNLAQKRVEFYEKMLAALEAGYVIVPNFPIDIFAIRTERNGPRGEHTPNFWADHKQASERPALGDGEYVDAHPTVGEVSWTEKNKEGKEVQKKEFFPENFLPVDFPLKMVAPQIMDATGRAMALKAFDELGVLPSRRAARTGNVDPMIIGQVVYRSNSRTEKRVSFLVAWWLTEEDLRI